MAERTTKPAVGMHDAPTGNPATDYSLALLTEFVRLGVRDVVLSPGSRSQALALVAAELEQAASVRLHVRIDERVSGFLALGPRGRERPTRRGHHHERHRHRQPPPGGARSPPFDCCR